MRVTARLTGWLLLTAAAAARPVTAQRSGFDILIRGGTLVDGTGAPRQLGDIAIRSRRIALIAGPGRIGVAAANEVIDATGLIVAPGFIDCHAHVATEIVGYPLAENFLRQGVTTIMASLHSGDQPYPLARYMAALRMAPNLGFFAGHSWIRKRVIGLANRAPTGGELARMEDLVEQAMRDGAFGLATGLEYVPASYAKTEEIIALARVAARHHGIYVTHLRDEGAGVLRSVEETIRIAREAGLPAQINHHKVSGLAQFGRTRQTLARIDSARRSGLDITLDVYPYTAFSTLSDVLFPAWALADGPGGLARRLADSATRARIFAEMPSVFQEQTGRGIESIQFRELPSDRAYNGRTLADWVHDREGSPTLEAGIAAVVDLQLAGGFIGIFHAMDEEDVERILRHPLSMIDSDGDLVGYGVGYPHPRSYGAFPRVLARYVRELGVLSLEEAIHKMTGLPAWRFGLDDRGTLRAGKAADLVVFDPERIQDLATYERPHQFSTGVVHLLVNGSFVMRNGALTGQRPGRALRRDRARARVQRDVVGSIR